MYGVRVNPHWGSGILVASRMALPLGSVDYMPLIHQMSLQPFPDTVDKLQRNSSGQRHHHDLSIHCVHFTVWVTVDHSSFLHKCCNSSLVGGLVNFSEWVWFGQIHCLCKYSKSAAARRTSFSSKIGKQSLHHPFCKFLLPTYHSAAKWGVTKPEDSRKSFPQSGKNAITIQQKSVAFLTASLHAARSVSMEPYVTKYSNMTHSHQKLK
jgi:hypothetical protein